jgi:hypothetical protein
MLGVPQNADKGDNIKPKLMLGKREPPFAFWP